MTKEEILAMKAGRELNIMVAENVIGCRVIHDQIFGDMERYDKYIQDSVLGGVQYFSRGGYGRLGQYSEDISAAWQVIRKLEKSNPRIEFDTSSQNWKATFGAGEAEFTGPVVLAATAPEAICKAALLFLMGVRGITEEAPKEMGVRGITEEAPKDRKNDLINRILDIELQWFLTVNPTLTLEEQQHPKVFKVFRIAAFEKWSEETLALYLEHLVDAQSKERNLMREKYAKIQGLIPCENSSQALTENLKIQEGWQKEAIEKYPRIFKQGVAGGITLYLRCELDTYSQAVLDSYYKDIKAASVEGRNVVMETYDTIAKKLGYGSLAEWHQKLEANGGQE